MDRKKKDRLIQIILVIIIIILILMLYLSFRIGNIGYKAISAWDGVDNIALHKLDSEITKETHLSIFDNLDKDGENILSPMASGEYKFSVKNETKDNIIYNIKFSESMQNFVNMKYRLKIDNIYIKGNENEYVNLEELNLNDIIVPKNSINVYTLEWCWENNDEADTKIGSLKDDEYYTFRLQIFSNIYNKHI